MVKIHVHETLVPPMGFLGDLLQKGQGSSLFQVRGAHLQEFWQSSRG